MRHKTVDLTKNTCPLKEKMCETLPKRFRDNATSKLCLGIELIMSHLYATSTSVCGRLAWNARNPSKFSSPT